eukprot:112658_1
MDNDENLSMSINDLYEANIQSHWSPYSINLFLKNNSSHTYFPSQKLQLNYSINDIYGNEIDYVGQNIIINFEAINTDELITKFQIIVDSNGDCIECQTGITFPSLTIDKIGNNYSFYGYLENEYLYFNDLINISITKCPSGYGANIANQCDVCSIGFYNLLATTDSCHYCNDNNLNGITCEGSNNIVVDYNVYAIIRNYGINADTNDNLYDTDNDYIISTKCPEKYCCQIKGGCNFIHDQDSLCAKNRDFNEYLCGKCLDGFSEVFGSSKCINCARNFVERFLFPIGLGFIWAIYILLTKSKKINDKFNIETIKNCACFDFCKMHSKVETEYILMEEDIKQKEKRCHCFTYNINPTSNHMTKDEYLGTLEVMTSKCLIYFYQSITYIFTTNQIKDTLYGFASIFNLDIFALIPSSGDNDGYCLLKNMTAPQKLSIPLISPAFVLFVILMLYLLSLECCCSINIFKSIGR